MTDRKELKRRVRARQRRTGESYVTARRHVLAQPSRIEVVEILDMTETGALFGMKCQVGVQPTLAERVDLRAVLERFRDLLIADGIEALAMMRRAVLGGEGPPYRVTVAIMDEDLHFLSAARAGAIGISDSGRILALKVEGSHGLEVVLFLLQLGRIRPPLVLVTSTDGAMADRTLDLAVRLRRRRRI